MTALIVSGSGGFPSKSTAFSAPANCPPCVSTELASVWVIIRLFAVVFEIAAITDASVHCPPKHQRRPFDSLPGQLQTLELYRAAPSLSTDTGRSNLISSD